MQEKKQRLLSLDFFRGLTVAAMILVNNPGSWSHIYPPFAHAEWNGCTPTDLVFPFFLWIVGVSIAFAMGSSKLDPSSHNSTLFKAFKRGCKLFFLGFFLSIFMKIINAFIDGTSVWAAFETVRILGVLQRIGIVFFISSFIFLKVADKNILKIIIGILVSYWLIMTFVPVPGVGYANLEKETNLAAWLDRTILTEAHLWSGAKTWDPEGLLTTIPAIASCLFGILVGIWIKRKDIEPATKIAWLFSIGVITAIIGLIWDLQFPINKSLWTSSYVLYTGGLATIGLALCYWLIDIQRYKKYTMPFVAYGVNAITVFFLSGFLPRILNLIKINNSEGEALPLLRYVYTTFFTPYLSPYNASLAYAIAFILAFYILMHYMYKKNIIIKV